jgi:acetyl-CoA synthetase (ADP-forming)
MTKMTKSDALRIIDEVRREGRKNLTEYESKKVLASYDFPITKEKLVGDEDEAIKTADEIGYPVVLKVVSPQIIHKSDVGGVKLDVKNPDELRRAYRELMGITRDLHGILVQEMVAEGNEVIMGMAHDPQFGPVLMFGLGGVFVEVLKDFSLRIPPLSRYDAEEMIKEIRAYPILEGARGRVASDLDSLIDCLLKLSDLAMDLGDIIDEMDVNPLFAKEDSALAADSLILLK